MVCGGWCGGLILNHFNLHILAVAFDPLHQPTGFHGFPRISIWFRLGCEGVKVKDTFETQL